MPDLRRRRCRCPRAPLAGRKLPGGPPNPAALERPARGAAGAVAVVATGGSRVAGAARAGAPRGRGRDPARRRVTRGRRLGLQPREAAAA